MRTYFSAILLSVIMTLSFSPFPSYSEDSSVVWVTEPLSQRYLEWEAEQSGNNSTVPDNKATPGGKYPTGYIPIPVDLSHLAYNLPVEPYSPTKDVHLVAKYDLRDDSYIPSAVRNQNPYGTCWAHAAIGAMESNYMKQGYSELDLSEMHLAYFAFINSNKSKAFHSVTSFEGAMNHGGNSFYPAALYSRLDGPVLEIYVPYGENRKPLSSTPESYTRVMRLKEVYYLGMDSKAPTVGEQRNVIKQRIKDSGAVVASYYHSDSNYQKTANGTAFHSTTKNTNHAVQIVGWDDSYSRNNFKTKPGSDGAWLMKNSWGSMWGDDGYFWMSYESYLTDGTAFIVEKNNPDLKAYYYDALGWTLTSGYTDPKTDKPVDNYAANVFRAERDGEKLVEVGFYTPDNNMTCEIKIYTELGTSMPSKPNAGSVSKVFETTIPYAGYHTVSLASPIPLTRGQYFSVVVKYPKHLMPLEMKKGMGPNASIEDGSFFSSDGITWKTAQQFGANATIKAFTTSSAGDTKPDITTSSLPGGTISSDYSAMLSAYGATPITWSISSGSLPPGLTLNSDGTISGKPTTKGDYTFTVNAKNSKGDTTKQFKITVSDLPVITTTAFEGYVGYNFTGQLSLNSNISAKWSATNLPKGLKLNADTGAITGKPSKAGDSTSTVEAETSAGVSRETVNFSIKAKPVKANLKTTKIPDIEIGASVMQKLTITGTEPIDFEVLEGMPDGLNFNSDSLTFYGTPTEAGSFTIKVSISNIVNELSGKNADVKKITFKVKAKAPKINAPASLPDGEVNEEYPDTQITLSAGTAPEKWTASGLPKGLTIGQKTGLISGTPTKSGKFNVTITAKNNGGQDKTGKIPLMVYMFPEITMKSLKNGTTDKPYSVKLAAKGEPSEWDAVNLPLGLDISKDNKGNFLIAGTPTTPSTSQVTLSATNKLGTDQTTLPLVIKGVAPKIKATLPKTATVNSSYTAAIQVDGTKPFSKLTYEIAAADLAKARISSLEELGLTFNADTLTGIASITGTPKYSVKGLPVQIVASNSEKENVKKKISLKVAGTKPKITSPSAEVKQTLSAGSPVNIDFVCTGTEKLAWSMKAANGFTLTQDSVNPSKAVLAGTMPASGKVSTTVTVENADGKATLKVTLTVGTASSAALDEADTDEPLTEQAESEPEVPEVSLTVWAERSEGDIGRAEREAIAREGYTVVAVLPELRADADGMYDFDVELDDDAEVGRTLVWLAFPQNAGVSADDEIAEFSDESGVETETVPESRKVKVSVWLREGVLYAPVIAVK